MFTRNSAIVDKPARCVYRSVKVTKHSTIPYVRYSFLFCNSNLNFVFKTNKFYDIRLQECRDLEIRVRGHSRSLKVVSIYRFGVVFLLVFYRNFVRKMHGIWDIRLQKCRDLENRVRDPSRSLEMSPCDRAHMTSYWRSIVTIALSRVVSETFNVKKCRDLKMGVKGHSRSLRVVSFDRSCMVSY